MQQMLFLFCFYVSTRVWCAQQFRKQNHQTHKWKTHVLPWMMMTLLHMHDTTVYTLHLWLTRLTSCYSSCRPRLGLMDCVQIIVWYRQLEMPTITGAPLLFLLNSPVFFSYHRSLTWKVSCLTLVAVMGVAGADGKAAGCDLLLLKSLL